MAKKSDTKTVVPVEAPKVEIIDQSDKFSVLENIQIMLRHNNLRFKLVKDGKEIMFKYGDKNLIASPVSAFNNKPMIAYGFAVPDISFVDFQNRWGKTVATIRNDPHYDEFVCSSMFMSIQSFDANPRQFMLHYDFESEYDIRATLKDWKAFEQICKLIVQYLESWDATKAQK
jgi:hypothetical protein